MSVTRRKDVNWRVANSNGETESWDQAQTAVLMDIRDELKAINAKLGCYRVPRALDDLNSLGKWARRRKPKRKKAVQS